MCKSVLSMDHDEKYINKKGNNVVVTQNLLTEQNTEWNCQTWAIFRSYRLFLSTGERRLSLVFSSSSSFQWSLDDDPILMRQQNMRINVIHHLFIHNILFFFYFSKLILTIVFSFFLFRWFSSIITSVQLTGHRIFAHTCGYNNCCAIQCGEREIMR